MTECMDTDVRPVAAVDIGTNTVRCLVVRGGSGSIQPLHVGREVVRLGAGLRSTSEISPQAAERLCDSLGRFGSLIRASGCRRAWAIATSALRDAGNRHEVLSRAGATLGVEIQVLSGELEAALTSSGVQAGIGPVRNGLMLDIGGGSTELVRLREGSVDWWVSFDEGVVHLQEELISSDPPNASDLEAVRNSVRRRLKTLPHDGGETLAATAGTPTTLAAVDLAIDEYDPTLVNGHVLTRQRVGQLSLSIVAATSSGRLMMAGMERGREDLIVPGVIMVEEVMDRWGFETMVVSDWGLLEGVALACVEGEGVEL